MNGEFMKTKKLLLACILLLSVSFLYAKQLEPPVATAKPHPLTVHGEERVDPYFWLREKNNPEVVNYLKTENAFAEQALAHTKPLQEKLYTEMLSRIKQDDLSVPYRYGDYFYYSRTEKGKQYGIQCRKKGSLDAPEEVLLDLNVLAEGKTFMGLGAFEVSDDGNLLAYSTDPTGFRVYTLHVKDLRTGRTLPDTAEDVGSVFWAADNKTLFYTTKDSAKRSYRLYRHVLGSKKDDLLHEEKDERFNVYGYRTRSKEYMIFASGSLTTTEVSALKSTDPDGDWKMIVPRKQDREVDIEHHGEHFYLRVNDKGRNFRLVRTPIANSEESSWREVVPHREDVMLQGVDFFADHYVLSERRDGLPQLRIIHVDSGESHNMAFPEPVYTASLSINEEWDTPVLRYNYQSMVTPSSVYDYNVKTREQKLMKKQEVLGGYDQSQYASERLWATAKDGTKVPISIVYKRTLKKDGSAPLLLYGYGSYGSNNSATFSSNRLSLLDRGFVYAVAHIRGGGEMGTNWHDQGRMMNKMNTFNDFIACAEHLIENKYTSKERLVIEGGSAGGLLMGVVTNLRPDLFKAVVNHVPFVDVINTMLDSSLPLTAAEFEEWGNPKNKAEYDYMKQYCPYTNIAKKEYPSLLVKTSFNDSQVMYWEPAKYVARMRAMKTDKNPLIFVINMGAGHGGSSGRYDRLREIALDYAFMLDQTGIKQ
jgi:oligopeptidase B